MTTRVDPHSLVRKCVFLTLLVAAHAAPQVPCDKESCPGPLRHYKELGCTPIYENPGDCCAARFDCSHLKNLSKDKCYVNGHEYEVGEKLRDEDRNPCDIECRCGKFNDVASFICAAYDCALIGLQPNCFYRNSADLCCPGPMVCLAEGEERATCEVDGKIYKDGEYFKPESEPEKECYCKPGYKGENVEPFCITLKHSYCSPLFRQADIVHKNCVPTFYNNQNPQKDCSYASRCQNAKDIVIHSENAKSHVDTDESEMCRFGNMTMHVGDELNQGTFYDSVCMKCVCEVPPIPTCQRLPDSECDVTKHEPFGDDGVLHIL
ncbi:uncharacterized protein LOC143185854 [Calliopsis andreniformis]|uniref:uncharacterized protein LOC143185854 n=1 Tax=Calliopsis andreniformis TaxID=337506 RepID=UPI003FCE141A